MNAKIGCFYSVFNSSPQQMDCHLIQLENFVTEPCQFLNDMAVYTMSCSREVIVEKVRNL